ncbi:MAG: lysozyme inhibitor LprI family protein, partial [Pseudomonadota bacterium]
MTVSLIYRSVPAMRCLPSLFLLLLMVTSSPAQAFDCAKAGTETEKLICSDKALKQADDDLGTAWRKARGLVGETEFKMLRQNQRAWLKTRDARCGYGSDAERVACLLQQTTQRTLIIAAKAKTGPGAGAAMVPFARVQAGSKTAYEVEVAGVRFAAPAGAGEVSFNKAVDDLVSQAPFTEKIDFETAGQLSYNQSITLEYAAPNLVSALVQTWRYDGGAHGNYVFSSINISPDTGEL